ncbi:hypothetical protein ACWDKQ_18670 [Saccharopolyspora sp. NPDC000995]
MQRPVSEARVDAEFQHLLRYLVADLRSRLDPVEIVDDATAQAVSSMSTRPFSRQKSAIAVTSPGNR